LLKKKLLIYGNTLFDSTQKFFFNFWCFAGFVWWVWACRSTLEY